MKTAISETALDSWQITSAFGVPGEEYPTLRDALEAAQPMDSIASVGQPEIGGTLTLPLDHLEVVADIPGTIVIGFADGINAFVARGPTAWTLRANGLDNYFFSGEGDDRIWMGAGDDSAEGNGGDDVIRLRSGNDFAMGGDGADKVFGGRGADYIEGGDGADTLDGEGGRDTIDGGTGDDLIRGGTGRDKLTGGAGSDRFVFRAGDGADVITDFEAGVDLIDLRKHAGVSGFDDLRLDESGRHLVIEIGADRITLKGVDAVDLTDDAFLF